MKKLLTNYGSIADLGFDTPNQMTVKRASFFKPLLVLVSPGDTP